MFTDKKTTILNMLGEAREAGVGQAGRIKAAFALAETTQNQLAEAFNLDKTDTSKTIKGVRNTPKIQTAIAKFLELPGTLLFDKYRGEKSGEDYLF